MSISELIISQGGLHEQIFTCKHSIIDIHTEVKESKHENKGTHFLQVLHNGDHVQVLGKLIPNIVVQGRHKDGDDDQH